MSESFSFRWGVPFLDEDFTQFPNAFWRTYHHVVSRNEWLFICHLATYKYESVRGKCSVGLETVADQMGYASVRSVQKLREALVERGLLQVRYRPGETSIYDFSGLSKALLKLSLELEEEGGEFQFTPESQFTGEVNPSSPGDEPQFTGGMNPSSPKEEKRKGTEEEEEKGGAAAPVSDGDGDELFGQEQERPEKPRRRAKRFKVGTDPALDVVKASDLRKERDTPDWAMTGPEGVHPAFQVVKAFCELTSQLVDTLGTKRGESLLRHYSRLAKVHHLSLEQMAEAHSVLRGSDWGEWYVENHKWSTGYEGKYTDQLVLAAGQIRDGTMTSEGDPRGDVPYTELTGMDMILARKRQREEQLRAEGKSVPKGLWDDQETVQ